MTAANTAQTAFLSHEELVRRAAALVPVLRERAAQTELDRQVPAETVRDLADAGLLRVSTPEWFGGHGHEYNVSVDVTMELARGCGSTAWCYSVWQMHNAMIGNWSLRAQEEYFADGPDRRCSTANQAVRQTIEPDGDGYWIAGQWQFSSGCDRADGVMVAASGPDGRMWAPVEPRDYTILDTWHVSGLRGTGSKDVLVARTFVPRYRTQPMAAMENPHGPWPGWELHHRATYRVPHHALFTPTVTGPVIGIAQNAVEEFGERLRGTSGPGRTADNVPLQLRLAEATVEVETARLLVRQTMREVIARGLHEDTLTPLEVAQYRARYPFAAAMCVRAVDRLFDASGGHSIYDPNPLPRLHRDIHAAVHHASNQWDVQALQLGRLTLGLPPLPPAR